MSASHCMHHALRIAKRPVSSWHNEVAQLPEKCEHDDCGAPRCCRERVGAYLRIQEQIIKGRPMKSRGRR